MKLDCKLSMERFAILLRECLENGELVHIDDLGIFLPGLNNNGFRFVPNRMPRVFIAYVQEDVVYARLLYRDLAARGFATWLDKKKLLPARIGRARLRPPSKRPIFSFPVSRRIRFRSAAGFTANSGTPWSARPDSLSTGFSLFPCD